MWLESSWCHVYTLKESPKRLEIVQVCLPRTWFWLSSESESNSSLTESLLMAIKSNSRNSACTESSLSTFHLSFLLSHTFPLFLLRLCLPVVTDSSVHQVHILSNALSRALNCCFFLPADQCWCFNLAMQESHKAAGSCGRPDDMPEWVQVVLCNRGLNSYAVVQLVIRSIPCIRVTVRGITSDFYNRKQCGDAADRLIDGNLGVERWIFFFRKTLG